MGSQSCLNLQTFLRYLGIYLDNNPPIRDRCFLPFCHLITLSCVSSLNRNFDFYLSDLSLFSLRPMLLKFKKFFSASNHSYSLTFSSVKCKNTIYDTVTYCILLITSKEIQFKYQFRYQFKGNANCNHNHTPFHIHQIARNF